jgi:ATP-dependent Clp protease ATP-binding subunit ClpX
MGKRALGFRAGAEDDARPGRHLNADLLDHIQPGDLIKYGLIPEFVGRLPVVGTLLELDKGALIEILTKPRNALVKQYQKLFEFENVKLKFTSDALEAIAEQAMIRKMGARGLKIILEDLMLDLMYQLPSQKKFKEFVISREMVENKDILFALMEKAG